MVKMRPAAVLARRCTSTQVPGLDEFLDEHAFNTPPLQWPAVPKRKDVQTLAREIRTRIVADDTNAALDMLRNVPQPYPRLIVHTTHLPSSANQQPSCRASIQPPSQLPPRPSLPWCRKHRAARTAPAPPAAPFAIARCTTGLRTRSPHSAGSLHPGSQTLRPPPERADDDPHSRDHLRRRLAVLRLEDNRPSASLFANLCFRLAGVISSLSKNPDSGLLAPVLLLPGKHANLRRPSTPPTRMPPPPPPQSPMTLQRASHTGVSSSRPSPSWAALVDARQASLWRLSVRGFPPHSPSLLSYTMIDGRPKRADGRDHLRAVLERYTIGLVRRGLRHRMPTLRTADAPPDGIPGYLGAVEFDGLGARERRKRRIAERTETGRATRGEEAPNSNLPADDSLMPPPLMPTYEALLKVLLSPGNYEHAGASKEQRARWNEAAERVEAILDKHELAPFVEEEAGMEVEGGYPNPSSVSLPRASGQAQVRLGPAPLTHHRVRMAASVLAHMMYERSPPMPPWESMPIMWLLARRADVLTPLIGRAGPFVAPTDQRGRTGREWRRARAVGDSVGRLRARGGRRRSSAAEARRIISEEEHKVGAASIEEEDWAVDGQSGVLRPSEAEEDEDDLEELDTFNRRMVAKTWDRELELYYSGGAQSE
ncbi:hypothetical protein B0H14DRAFT_2752264 [Mycena olivaceomarginata]|nr:hypothetical protein B0H14DRAFT_2752264 [Mycena olivaceomarginata]